MSMCSECGKERSDCEDVVFESDCQIGYRTLCADCRKTVTIKGDIIGNMSDYKALIGSANHASYCMLNSASPSLWQRIKAWFNA